MEKFKSEFSASATKINGCKLSYYEIGRLKLYPNLRKLNCLLISG